MIAHLSCLRGKQLSEHGNMKGFLYERKWHTKSLMQKVYWWRCGMNRRPLVATKEMVNE